MIIVNRTSFMAWVDGILLDRDSEGRVLVGDNVNHERAEDAMARGETIGLTRGGVIISKMKLIDDGFQEFQE